MRKKLFTLSLLTLLVFTYFSYTVAKERWQQIDFDIMVKIQDKTPERFDRILSYFTIIGNAEITFLICLFFSLIALFKKRFLALIGWLLIIPATIAEVFSKLVLFHPSPPVFFHRTIIPNELPEFYVQTNFSYPSGHMTRTIFIITLMLCIIIFSNHKPLIKTIEAIILTGLAIIIAYTRIYLGEHWLSDVLGGGMLGLSVGLFAAIFVISKPKKLNILQG